MVPPCVGNPAGEVMAAGHSGRGRTATAGGHAAAAACPDARPRAMASPPRKRMMRLLVTSFMMPDSHAKTPAGRVDCAPSTLSVRSAAADDRADGACQDAQVEEHREILDVEEVEPGVQMQRQLAAAVHLPPSRHAG